MQEAMSALHPIADMCGATRDVRYGPKTDMWATSVRLLVGMIEHITKRVVGRLIPELKIQTFQVNLAALFSEYSRVKAPRFFWANLYEIPNRMRVQMFVDFRPIVDLSRVTSVHVPCGLRYIRSVGQARRPSLELQTHNFTGSGKTVSLENGNGDAVIGE